MRLPQYEVFPDGSGGWRYRLRASNGEIVAQSEGYTSRKDARRGVRAARVASLTAKVVDGG